MKAHALAAIASASGGDEESPFDPFIPSHDVGGGDPGVAWLLASDPRLDDTPQ
ncbi:MAG: hypothetical protein R3F56_03845 [Planctomycetota bacterium]